MAQPTDAPPPWTRQHTGPPLGARDHPDPRVSLGSCWGTLHSLYTRIGSPPRWTRVGRVCRKCRAFWPDPASDLWQAT